MTPRRTCSGGSSSAVTLVAAILGFFVITFDAVVVNVALPSISDDFASGITGLQWVVDGYTLMFAALLLWSGALADRVGARSAFAVGLGVFVAASVACAAAPSLAVLIVARFVQGSAAAVMMPSSMALLGQAYEDPVLRARAVAMWAMGGALASSTGPVLGGLLTLVSWRLIFVVNVPVGAAAMWLTSRIAPSPRRRVPFDWFGQASGIVAMSALTYGVIEGGAVGFDAPQVVGAIALAGVASVAFVVVESRVAHPMVPLRLFGVQPVRASIIVGFAFVVGYCGLPFVMSLYLQQLRGLSAFRAGLVFVPMMVSGSVVTPFSARIAERFGARRVITLGLVVLALGQAMFLVISETTPITGLALMMIVVGLAGPLTIPPITAVLLNSVPNHEAGTASGVFNTGRQIGGALAVAVFGGLIGSDVDLGGVRLSVSIAALVALAAAASAARLPRVVRDRH